MDTSSTLNKSNLQLTTSSNQRGALYKRFKSKIIHNPCLDRTLVSFQANKETQFSWFKYREGFSEKLVTYLIETLIPKPGALLDPFAGVGTSLFTASDLNWQTIGIELLPVGVFAIEAKINARTIDVEALSLIINQIKTINFSDYYDQQYAFNHLAITCGAFPESQEIELVGYISYCKNHIQDISIGNILLFAAFCILEDISYTRKDGQYLRWDSRSSRSRGKKEFCKGGILLFKDAIHKKLSQILSDLSNKNAVQLDLFDFKAEKGAFKEANLQLHQGTCLQLNLGSLF